MAQPIPPNSDQRVLTLRSEILHANRFKNVLLTIVTLGYHYRNTLYNKAQTLLGRLNSLDSLQNTINALKKLDLPPEVKTHKAAVDHIYDLLGPNFKATYSEEFLRSMIKTTLVAQPNPQVTTHAQWKQLKTDMRAKIQGSEGNHHIPTLQKWKGLESLMKEIYHQITSGNQNILQSLKNNPNFSKLYTTRELKGLLEMAKVFQARGKLENFKFNPKILENNYQALWLELMGITESKKTIRQENDYHLLDEAEIVAPSTQGLTLSNLATVGPDLYSLVNATSLSVRKTEIPSHLARKIPLDADVDNLLQDTQFSRLFTREELAAVIQHTNKIRMIEPVFEWIARVEAQSTSVSEMHEALRGYYSQEELDHIRLTPEIFKALPLHGSPEKTWNRAMETSKDLVALTEHKIEKLPQLLSSIETKATLTRQLNVFSQAEIQLIRNAPEFFQPLVNEGNPIRTWETALKKSKQKLIANTQSIANHVQREASSLFNRTKGKYSPAGEGYLSKQELHVYRKDLTRDLDISDSFVQDFPRIGQISYSKKSDEESLVSETTVIEGSDANAAHDLLKDLHEKIDPQNILTKNLQKSLCQDFTTYFTTLFQEHVWGLMGQDVFINYVNPEIELEESADGRTIHQKLTMRGSLTDLKGPGGSPRQIGNIAFTVEFDHVKDPRTNRWTFANVHLTQSDIKADLSFL
jgi:hypothetical protein